MPLHFSGQTARCRELSQSRRARAHAFEPVGLSASAFGRIVPACFTATMGGKRAQSYSGIGDTIHGEPASVRSARKTISTVGKESKSGCQSSTWVVCNHRHCVSKSWPLAPHMNCK